MLLRRMLGACISIYKADRRPCLKVVMAEGSNSTTEGSNSMEGNSTVDISRVDILDSNRVIKVVSSNNNKTITTMRSWRSWPRSSCRRLLGSWRDAVLLCRSMLDLVLAGIPMGSGAL